VRARACTHCEKERKRAERFRKGERRLEWGQDKRATGEPREEGNLSRRMFFDVYLNSQSAVNVGVPARIHRAKGVRAN
jgi:hypothetical protein